MTSTAALAQALAQAPALPAATKPFVQVAEIWRPTGDGEALVFGGGYYRDLDAFEAASRPMRFRRGEGLPGEAWAARHPVVMRSLANSRFRRLAAAAEAGLTSGIAMPLFVGDRVKAVVVLLCGDDAAHVGAVEAWRHDPEVDAQIGLHEGYYGGAELFERQSRMTRFGKGSGLPGAVWAADMPIVLRDLYRSKRFLRRDEALEAGLTTGLGLPFAHDPGRVWVTVFLSALGTPIARRFEVWVPSPDGTALAYDAGLSEDAEAAGARPAQVTPGDGLLGQALATGAPAITRDCAADAPWLVPADDGAYARAALALPTLDAAGRLQAVTLWGF